MMLYQLQLSSIGRKSRQKPRLSYVLPDSVACWLFPENTPPKRTKDAQLVGYFQALLGSFDHQRQSHLSGRPTQAVLKQFIDSVEDDNPVKEALQVLTAALLRRVMIAHHKTAVEHPAIDTFELLTALQSLYLKMDGPFELTLVSSTERRFLVFQSALNYCAADSAVWNRFHFSGQANGKTLKEYYEASRQNKAKREVADKKKFTESDLPQVKKWFNNFDALKEVLSANTALLSWLRDNWYQEHYQETAIRGLFVLMSRQSKNLAVLNWFFSQGLFPVSEHRTYDAIAKAFEIWARNHRAILLDKLSTLPDETLGVAIRESQPLRKALAEKTADLSVEHADLFVKVALSSHDRKLAGIALSLQDNALSEVKGLLLFQKARQAVSQNNEAPESNTAAPEVDNGMRRYVNDTLCPLLEDVSFKELEKIDPKLLDAFISLLSDPKLGEAPKARYDYLIDKCNAVKRPATFLAVTEKVAAAQSHLNSIGQEENTSHGNVPHENASYENAGKKGAISLLSYFISVMPMGAALRLRAEHWAQLFNEVEKHGPEGEGSQGLHTAHATSRNRFFHADYFHAPRGFFYHRYQDVSRSLGFLARSDTTDLNRSRAEYYSFATVTKSMLGDALTLVRSAQGLGDNPLGTADQKADRLLQVYSASDSWEFEPSAATEVRHLSAALRYFSGKPVTPFRKTQFSQLMDVLTGLVCLTYKPPTKKEVEADSNLRPEKEFSKSACIKMDLVLDYHLGWRVYWRSGAFASALTRIRAHCSTGNPNQEALRALMAREHMGINRSEAEAVRFGCHEQFDALKQFLDLKHPEAASIPQNAPAFATSISSQQ